MKNSDVKINAFIKLDLQRTEGKGSSRFSKGGTAPPLISAQCRQVNKDKIETVIIITIVRMKVDYKVSSQVSMYDCITVRIKRQLGRLNKLICRIFQYYRRQ